MVQYGDGGVCSKMEIGFVWFKMEREARRLKGYGGTCFKMWDGGVWSKMEIERVV